VSLAPTLLLPAALVEPQWADAARLATLAALPGWSALARRARVLAEVGADGPPPSEPGHERWLRTRFGLPPECAVAACSAIADDRMQADWRLDPVHLLVGRDHLVLTDPARLSLDADDARSLADAIAPLFADEGLALDPAVPSRWYLRELDPARPLRLRTRSMLGALGRNIDAWMPVGEDARRWRRLVNEVQMTWHTHPVNAHREARGLAAVNSLWIEGRSPGAASQAAQAAGAGDATDRGSRPSHAGAAALARIAVHRTAPADGDAAVEADRTGRVLVVDDGAGRLIVEDRLLEAHVAADPQRWAEVWRHLDATLFASIAGARDDWRAGARLVLAGDAGWRLLHIGPRADWRFWRRPAGAALLAEPASVPDDRSGPR